MLEVVVSLFSLLIVWLPAGFIMLPAVRAFYNIYLLVRLPGERNVPAFIPALTTGIALQMVFFSLLARHLSSFGNAFILAYFLLSIFSFAIVKTLHGPLSVEKVIWSRKSEIYTVLAFFVCWAVLLGLRGQFSYLLFDPARFGAEKLFNFGFQSSYIYSQQYPVENVWYAGHANNYYVLTKSLGGLPLRLLNVFSDHIYDGVMFHLADTFLYTLGLVALATFTFILTTVFGRTVDGKTAAVFALFTAFTPLIGGPFRLLAQSYDNRFDFWSLTRIIDFTINEYPFWNFLWADYHSHSSVVFVQLSFWFWILLFFGVAWIEHWGMAAIIGILLTAMLMSHSGSLLISAVGLTGLFVCLGIQAIKSKTLPQLVKKCLMIASVFLVCAAPDWLTRPKPVVEWYLVTKEYASPLRDYINIFFYLFLFGMALIIVRTAAFESVVTRRTKWILLSTAFIFVATLTFGWAGAGFAVLLFGMGYAVVNPCTAEHDSHSSTTFFVGLLCGISCLLIFPEILAANFDMGEKYMRYNTVFRFLFESYYLLPMLWVVVLIGSCRVYSPRAFAVLSYFSLTVIGLFTYGQFKTFLIRANSFPQPFSLDGLSAFKSERPADWTIVEFLRSQKGRVVIAEECGIDPKPGAYSIYGRIAAVSGRPAVCGWSHHVSLHHKEQEVILGKNSSSYGHTIDFDKATTTLFNEARQQPPPEGFSYERAKELFKAMGVTHLVYGEIEREHHPDIKATDFARIGNVVLNDNNAFVVQLQY